MWAVTSSPGTYPKCAGTGFISTTSDYRSDNTWVKHHDSIQGLLASHGVQKNSSSSEVRCSCSYWAVLWISMTNLTRANTERTLSGVLDPKKWELTEGWCRWWSYLIYSTCLRCPEFLTCLYIHLDRFQIFQSVYFAQLRLGRESSAAPWIPPFPLGPSAKAQLSVSLLTHLVCSLEQWRICVLSHGG